MLPTGFGTNLKIVECKSELFETVAEGFGVQI